MSRVHQGQSTSYLRKIQVREGRTFDRLMFRCAKYFHDIKYNIESTDISENSNHQTHGLGTDNNFLDRAFIRRWKTKIYRFLEKERNITLATFDNYSEQDVF